MEKVQFSGAAYALKCLLYGFYLVFSRLLIMFASVDTFIFSSLFFVLDFLEHLSPVVMTICVTW